MRKNYRYRTNGLQNLSISCVLAAAMLHGVAKVHQYRKISSVLVLYLCAVYTDIPKLKLVPVSVRSCYFA